jgi:hypothetical protein
MKRLTRIQVLSGYRLHLTFDDGVQGVVDLSDLAGRGVFAAWNDPARFEAVGIGEAGGPVWSDGLDLCPDALYMRVTGSKPDDLFPNLRHESVHA